jgi:hypothetical protein
MRSVATTRVTIGARAKSRIRPAATKPVKTKIAKIKKAIRATLKKHAAIGTD